MIRHALLCHFHIGRYARCMTWAAKGVRHVQVRVGYCLIDASSGHPASLMGRVVFPGLPLWFLLGTQVLLIDSSIHPSTVLPHPILIMQQRQQGASSLGPFACRARAHIVQ